MTSFRTRARMIAEEPLHPPEPVPQRLRGGARIGGSIQPCEWPGCTACGDYRAPRSRTQLREYQFLCLDHVREFNRAWDYFKGMPPEQIEAHRRDDVTWSRPTWPPGLNTADLRLKDPFELLHAHGFTKHSPKDPPSARPPSTAQAHAQTLGLAPGFTADEMKRRYKTLVKQHHPDLHGGDRHQEERLKGINAAYTWLLAHPNAC